MMRRLLSMAQRTPGLVVGRRSRGFGSLGVNARLHQQWSITGRARLSTHTSTGSGPGGGNRFQSTRNVARLMLMGAGVSAGAVVMHLVTSETAQADAKKDSYQPADRPVLTPASEMSHLPALHFQLPPTSTVYRFALTGGPCGGKSTALVEVADRLRSLGYQVFVVPEQATIFHIAGVHYPAGQSDAATITWEASRVLSQIAMEDAFARVAVATGKPTVILSDRGTMDTKAYMMEDKWQLMLDEMKWNVVALRDRRYDAVLHMVTAAIGAEKFYTQANNEARRESLSEAVEVDAKTRDAWIGHRQFRIIDNSTDFKTKVQRVTEFFCSYLNQPVPHGVRRYFLVRYLPDQYKATATAAAAAAAANNSGVGGATTTAVAVTTAGAANGSNALVEHKITSTSLPVRTQEAHLTSTFLKKKEDGCDIVLRRRGQDGHYTYSMAFKDSTSGQNIIRTRTLSSKQYLSLLDHADSTLIPVHRRRLCFQWGGQYYELEQPLPPLLSKTNDAPGGEHDASNDGPNVLIVESDQSRLQLPPFFQIDREVTGEYNLMNLARKLASPMPTATAAAPPAPAASLIAKPPKN